MVIRTALLSVSDVSNCFICSWARSLESWLHGSTKAPAIVESGSFWVVVSWQHIFSNWINLHLQLIGAWSWHISLLSDSGIITTLNFSVARHLTGSNTNIPRRIGIWSGSWDWRICIHFFINACAVKSITTRTKAERGSFWTVQKALFLLVTIKGADLLRLSLIFVNKRS